MGARCFWDDNTDSYAQEVFQNVRHTAATVMCQTGALAETGLRVSCVQDHLFCVAAAFGICEFPPPPICVHYQGLTRALAFVPQTSIDACSGTRVVGGGWA